MRRQAESGFIWSQNSNFRRPMWMLHEVTNDEDEIRKGITG